MGLALVMSGCHVARIVKWNYAEFEDHQKFPKKPISPLTKDEPGFTFQTNQPDRANVIAPLQIEADEQKKDFKDFLADQGTTAFMIMRNDTIYYEQYLNGYEKGDVLTSFSVAKSFVATLVGIAINEGVIGGVHDTVTQYLPEMADQGFDQVTIANLLNMQSGIEFRENYRNPFSDVAKYYYGQDLNRYLTQLEVVNEPGQKTKYQSANTQILARILTKVTGQSLTSYLSEKIAGPIGMKPPASWSIDSEGSETEKAFCCLNTTVRNFARFGRLYLNEGVWQGDTIVPYDWFKASTQVKGKPQNFEYFYHWWHCIDTRPVDDDFDSTMAGPYKKVKTAYKGDQKEKYVVTPCQGFYAKGYLGQYIYMDPANDLLILRFGKRKGNVDWPSFFQSYSKSLRSSPRIDYR